MGVRKRIVRIHHALYEKAFGRSYVNRSSLAKKTHNAVEKIRVTDRDMRKRIAALEKSTAKLEDLVRANAEKEQMLLWALYQQENETLTDAKTRFFRNLPAATGELKLMQDVGRVLLKVLEETCKRNGIRYWLGGGTLLGAVRHEGFIPWDDDVDVFIMREDIPRIKEAFADSEDFEIRDFFAVSTVRRKANRCVQLHYKQLRMPCCLDLFYFDYAKKLPEDFIPRRMEMRKAMGRECAKLYEEGGYTGFVTNTPDEPMAKIFEEYRVRYSEEFDLLDSSQGASAIVWCVENNDARQVLRANILMEDIFPLTTLTFEGREYPAPKNAAQYLDQQFEDYLALPDDMLTHRHFHPSERDLQNMSEAVSRYDEKY